MADIREIVFDTETTGLDPAADRLIEIGCVELINSIPTGRTFHRYINPGRPVPPDAVAIHGLDDAFLADKPPFIEIVDEFLRFVGDSPLVAHNAAFDEGFINMELERTEAAGFDSRRFVDTLPLARRRHPGSANSLDALCARYGIDNTSRVKHGALLDAELLAEVYIELLGGRQASLILNESGRVAAEAVKPAAIPPRPRPLASRLSSEAVARHDAFVASLGNDAVWQTYLNADPG